MPTAGKSSPSHTDLADLSSLRPLSFILTETLRSNAVRLLSRASSRLVVPKDEKSEGIEFVSSIAGTKLNNVVIVFYNALH
jgi:hypothetical protein